MRLLKLGIYHPKYLRDFYAERAGLQNLSYREQHAVLIEDCFGSSDFWTSELEKSGYETADIIANAEFLQKTWAIENDLNVEKTGEHFEIAAKQIKNFRPDILLVADYSTFSAEFLKTVKRECTSIKLILGWCGAPFNDLSVIREWDIALSCVPELVTDFRARGIRGFHINHAFAPRILDKINTKAAPDVEFSFIGSIVKQSDFHIERERLLLELIKHTNLQIWSPLENANNLSVRGRILKTISNGINAALPEKLVKSLPLSEILAQKFPAANPQQTIDERIVRRIHPPVFGIEMFQKLHNSRVVFNNHIDISTESASNMRLFETTGVGACLLTDWKKNLSELFEPDTEVLTYRSAEECVEKVAYVLAHEDERRTIAEAGQRRTLREHTFENRVARIDEIIRKYLNGVL